MKNFLKNKSTIHLAFIFLGVIIAVSFIAFFLNQVYDGFFWISYLFVLISLCGTFAATAYYASDMKRSLRYFPANFPPAYFCAIHLGLTALWILLGFFIRIPLRWYFAVHFLTTLVLGLMAYAAIYAAKKGVMERDDEIAKNVQGIRLLCADVDSIRGLLIELSDDSRNTLAPEIEALYEVLRYSDPMTIPEVEVYDVRIQASVLDIQNGVHGMIGQENQDCAVVLSHIRTAIRNTEDRNNRIKIMK